MTETNREIFSFSTEIWMKIDRKKVKARPKPNHRIVDSLSFKQILFSNLRDLLGQ